MSLADIELGLLIFIVLMVAGCGEIAVLNILNFFGIRVSVVQSVGDEKAVLQASFILFVRMILRHQNRGLISIIHIVKLGWNHFSSTFLLHIIIPPSLRHILRILRIEQFHRSYRLIPMLG